MNVMLVHEAGVTEPLTVVATRRHALVVERPGYTQSMWVAMTTLPQHIGAVVNRQFRNLTILGDGWRRSVVAASFDTDGYLVLELNEDLP